MTSQNSKPATARPRTFETRRGKYLRSLDETKVRISLKRRAAAINSRKVRAAMKLIRKGCALSRSSSPARTRIEFCHSKACQRKTAAMEAQMIDAAYLSLSSGRSCGSGTSR
jgi:hypothetical protein